LLPERLTGIRTDHAVTTDPDSADSVPRDEVTSELPIVPEPGE
ncbi:hypothetical protein DFO66_11760, partial [Brevibacterium sanguinis]